MGGPHDCGEYNSPAWDTSFFVSQGGSWDTEYGVFFLSWYSGLLLQHADRVLAAASEAMNQRGRPKHVSAVHKVCFSLSCHLSAFQCKMLTRSEHLQWIHHSSPMVTDAYWHMIQEFTPLKI